MTGVVLWGIVIVLVACWSARSVIDAIANRVVERIEQRVRERLEQQKLARRRNP